MSVDAVGVLSERVPLTVTVTNPVGVGQIAGLNGVTAYLVPTSGALSLVLDLGAEQMDLTMEVRDASGRLVASEQWNGQTTGRRVLDLGLWRPVTIRCASRMARANGACRSFASDPKAMT